MSHSWLLLGSDDSCLIRLVSVKERKAGGRGDHSIVKRKSKAMVPYISSSPNKMSALKTSRKELCLVGNLMKALCPLI